MAELDLASRAEAAGRACAPGGMLRSRRWLRALRAALSSLRRARCEGQETGAARWLTDNWYLAEREGRAALAALSGAKHLRRTAEGSAVVLCCCEQLLRTGAAIT